MSIKKISLPNIPKNSDRDTIVFLKAVKQAIDGLASQKQNKPLDVDTKRYIELLNRRVYEEVNVVVSDALGVGNLLELLNGSITNSQLHKDLSQRIEKIVSNENAISAERLERVADVLALSEDVIEERRVRAQELTDKATLLQQDIDDEAQARIDAVNQASQLILDERNERVADVLSNTNAINTEAQARANSISATNDLIDAETQDRLAALIEANENISNAETKISGVFAQVNPKLAGDDDRWAGDSTINVGVWSEQSARIENDMALGQSIETLRIDVEDSSALIRSELKVQVDATQSLASRTDVLLAKTGENKASINAESLARTTATNALSQEVVSLLAVTGDNTALITTEFTARTDADSALSTRIETLTATTGDNTAAIQTEQSARSDANEAIAFQIETLGANTGDNAAAIQTESTARTDANGALSNRIDTLVATTGDNTASIQSESITRADHDSALSSRIDTLVSTTGDNSALITEESTARTDADSALSQRITTLVSTTGGNTAAITDNFQALTTKTGANATRIEGVFAELTPKMAGDTNRWAGDNDPKNVVGVWTERSAIIENDIATAKRTDALSSQIEGNSATITQVNETLVSKNEVVASQINSLSARMIGGYDGNDLNEVTSGLIYQERTARATDIGGLAEQVSLLSAGVGEQFDSFEIWHFNQDREGWVNGVYASGFINVRTETINSPAIDVDGSVYRHVKLRIEKVGTPTWLGQLGYNGTTLLVDEPEYKDNFTIVNFYPNWSGTITAINLKLASAGDNLNYFKVDWIAIGRPSPGASYAALLREERARADKDMALTEDILSLDAQINGDGVNSSSSIVQKLTTTATKTDTTANELSTLSSTFNDEVFGADGVVTRNAQTAASASQALASDIDGVFATLSPNMAGDIDRWAGSEDTQDAVGVWTERSGIIEEGLARAEKFEAVTARIDKNKADISIETLARVTAINALAEQTTTIRADFEGNAGVMQTKITAQADATSALSLRTDTIQSTVGDNTASLQTTQESIDGINASWTLRADVNGVIGGIGINNDGTTVDVMISTSKFSLVGISGSAITPFVQTTQVTYINGQRVPIGTYMDAAFIKNGTITSASIGFGEIKSANIGFAEVDTLQLKGDSVTVSRAIEVPRLTMREDKSYPIGTPITMDFGTGKALITIGINSLYSAVERSISDVYFKLYRNGDLIKTYVFQPRTWREQYDTDNRGDPLYNYYAQMDLSYIAPSAFIDFPAPNQTHTYTVEVEKVNTSQFYSQDYNIHMHGFSIHILGIKR